jgi:hypothetical protein
MKKILSSILLVSLLNLFVGCYSYKAITVQEYNKIEKEDKPDDIRVMTKDYQVYQFSDSNFYIKDDTLYSKNQIFSNDNKELTERKIALTDIADIEIKKFDWLNTILLSLGIYLCVGLIVGISIGLSHWEK